MALPTITYDQLRNITSDRTKESDERIITEIVNKIYERVVHLADIGYYFVAWESNFDYYKYKHIVLAANRLRVLFPGAVIEQKRGHTITVDWY